MQTAIADYSEVTVVLDSQKRSMEDALLANNFEGARGIAQDMLQSLSNLDRWLGQHIAALAAGSAKVD